MMRWFATSGSAVVCVVVLATACVLPSQATPVASPTHPLSPPAGTPLPATATVVASPTIGPTPTSLPPATPTPTPVPVAQAVTTAGCCGAFAWLNGSDLLTYDEPAGEPPGAYVANIESGARRRLDRVLGYPSSSGLIAIPDPAAGGTRIVQADGTLRGRIANGGAPTWIAPDGTRAAWLERLPRRTPSSLLPRPVRLWVAGVDGSGARAVMDLLTGQVQWLADSRRLVMVARATDGASPGIWVVDVDTGSRRVLLAAPFVQALRVSSDGTRVAYLVTFSGDPTRDGVGVAEIDGPGRWHLPFVGSYRWAGDNRSLWRLELAGPRGGNDHVVLVDVQTGVEQARVDLGGRVLNDTWEVAPGGHALAYWREADRQVVVVRPLP